MRPRRVVALCFLLLTSTVSSVRAQHGTFTLQKENDLFALNDRTDRAYTNGTRLMWTWSPKASSWADRLVGKLCGGEECRRSATLGLGQSMYTPENLQSRRKIRRDRPYGGWLYGLLMLDATKEETADHVEMYAGVIGRASYAAEAQKFIHEYVTPAAPEPLGWDTQIGERPGILAVYEHRVKFLQFRDRRDLPFFDVTPALGGAVGNVFDDLSAGSTVRLGYNLPPHFLRPIPSLLGLTAESGDDSSALNESRWDAYVFATAEARYVLRNVFIDADHESYGIRREPLVRDRRVGASVRFRQLRLEYAHTIRSPEFKPDSRSHSYGTFILSVGTQP